MTTTPTTPTTTTTTETTKPGPDDRRVKRRLSADDRNRSRRPRRPSGPQTLADTEGGADDHGTGGTGDRPATPDVPR